MINLQKQNLEDIFKDPLTAELYLPLIGNENRKA